MHSLHYVKVCASLRLLAPEACQSRCVSGNLNTIPTRHSRRAFFRTQDGLPRDDCLSRKCAHKHAFGMGRAPILKHFGETMELCELWDASQKRFQRNIKALFFYKSDGCEFETPQSSSFFSKHWRNWKTIRVIFIWNCGIFESSEGSPMITTIYWLPNYASASEYANFLTLRYMKAISIRNKKNWLQEKYKQFPFVSSNFKCLFFNV